MTATTTTATFSTSNLAFEMNVANLGDSGLLVIENQTGTVVFQTEEQHHYFNCPYQLGTSTDTPDDAIRSSYTILSGMDRMEVYTDLP
jgi:serine/threonine protein phosphatase PrpC